MEGYSRFVSGVSGAAVYSLAAIRESPSQQAFKLKTAACREMEGSVWCGRAATGTGEVTR